MQGRAKGGAIRASVRGAKLHSAKEVAGITGNLVPVISGFHTRNNFSENYPQFGHEAKKKIRQPSPRTKSIKKRQFEEHQIISSPRAPTCPWYRQHTIIIKFWSHVMFCRTSRAKENYSLASFHSDWDTRAYDN